MEHTMNLREELVEIIKIRAGEGSGQKRASDWVKCKKDRDRRMAEAFEAVKHAEKGSWVEQLSSIIREFEEKPEWKSTLDKLRFGNQVNLKRLGECKKDYKGEFNYLVPIAVPELHNVNFLHR